MSDHDLEELWTSVQRAQPLPTIGKHAKKPSEVDPRRVYLDPENWIRTRGIALIHAETQTLLGNFSEYTHKSIAGCRKLLREESPIAVSASEVVEGSWWLGEDRKPIPPQVWHERRTAIVHVFLEALKVHSPICEVVACLSYGAIDRIELALDTTFAQTEGAEQLLELPAGTNIRDVMSIDSKVALRKEIGL